MLGQRARKGKYRHVGIICRHDHDAVECQTAVDLGRPTQIKNGSKKHSHKKCFEQISDNRAKIYINYDLSSKLQTQIITIPNYNSTTLLSSSRCRHRINLDLFRFDLLWNAKVFD